MKMRIADRVRLYILLAALFVLAAGIITFLSYSSMLMEIEQMFEQNVHLSAISAETVEIENSLQNYLISNDQEYKDECSYHLGLLSDHAAGIAPKNNSQLMANLNVMLNNYIADVNTCLMDERSGWDGSLVEVHNTALDLGSSIRFLTRTMVNGQMLQDARDNAQAISGLRMTLFMCIIAIEIMFLVTYLLSAAFADKITRPIISMSKFTKRVSRGEYGEMDLHGYAKDEMLELAQSLNAMAGSIRRQMDDVEQKALLETQLKEQEVTNYKMKELLAKTELMALQSQINPHFLYNALNTGANVAILEDAEETGKYLKELSKLFRYNLSELSRMATVREELEHCESYCHIMEMRFQKRIAFRIEADPKCLELKMPRMILQPLVENAYVHGLASIESGGRVMVDARIDGEKLILSVKDNGMGMDAKRMRAVLEQKSGGGGNQSSGIGLKNVLGRLKLQYQKEDAVEIVSGEGEGFCVILSLPAVEG